MLLLYVASWICNRTACVRPIAQVRMKNLRNGQRDICLAALLALPSMNSSLALFARQSSLSSGELDYSRG